DDEEKNELYPIYFYNGLRGEAKLWFDRLNSTIQEDWERVKKEFLKKFDQENSDKQQRFYFHQQLKTLRQGNKSITDYLKEGETLASLVMNEDMAYNLAQVFIDGIANPQHRQMLDMHLPDGLYTFEDVKSRVRKLYVRSPDVASSFAYAAAATSVEVDPVTKMTQAFERLCDKIATPSAPSRSPSPYSASRPRPEMLCFNCLKPGHTAPICSHPPVSREQFRKNQEEVWRRREQQQESYGQENQSTASAVSTTTSNRSDQQPAKQVSFAANSVVKRLSKFRKFNNRKKMKRWKIHQIRYLPVNLKGEMQGSSEHVNNEKESSKSNNSRYHVEDHTRCHHQYEEQ
ncbi:hypothetical protein GP486_008522, partial [Trichoglossum hirsutum]